MIRRVLKDGIIYTIPVLVTQGISLLLLPIYTRILSPEQYGALDILLLSFIIVHIVIGLEISQGIARYYSDTQHEKEKIVYASSAWWFIVFFYLVFFLLAFFFAAPLATMLLGESGYTVILQMAVVCSSIAGLFSFVLNQYRWSFKSKEYAALSILASILSSVCALFFAVYKDLGLLGILLGMSAGTGVALMIGLIGLRKTFLFTFDKAKLADMLAFSFPLVPAGLAFFVSSYIDRLMINHYLSLEDVAIYSVGNKIATIGLLAMVGFQGALTPLIYTQYRSPETAKKIGFLFKWFMIASLLCYVLVNMFAKEIIQILATPNYYAASTLLIVLIPAILFNKMYIFAPGLSIAKKTSRILLIQILGACINLFGNTLFIPYFGYMGAAISTLVSAGLVFFFYIHQSKKYYTIAYQGRPLIMLSLVAVCCSLYIQFISTQTGGVLWLVRIGIITLFLYCIVLFRITSIKEVTQRIIQYKK